MSSPTAEDKMGKVVAGIVTVAVIFIIFAGFAILKILGVL